MKSLILWCFVAIVLLQGASTTTKIENSKKHLSTAKSDRAKASRKLGKIATDIKKAEKDINYLAYKLEKLNANKQKSEKRYTILKTELVASEKILDETSKKIDKKHKTFISLLSEQFSVIFAMQQFKTPTEKSIISYEVYKTYKTHNAKELKVLKNDIVRLNRSKKSKKYEHDKIEKSIAAIIKQRELYSQQKAKKEKIVARLGNDEEKYEKKLQNLVDKQSSLRSTLAKLNILHGKEVDAARKRAEAKREAIRLEKERMRKIRKAKALARKKAKEAKEAKAAIKLAKTKEAKKAAKLAAVKAVKAAKAAKIVQNKVYKKSAKVRKVHSSYKQSKTYAYRGKKTISPIAGAKVIKKFGTYVDPIYKIKIFNESITLKAPKSNVKVKNVLDGKIVFSGKSSMLGRVVVVAHSGKIHTVYAGLSRIAPNIKVGRKIRKGYVIGKVSHKLMFQATKNSKHINPLRLIKI